MAFAYIANIIPIYYKLNSCDGTQRLIKSKRLYWISFICHKLELYKKYKQVSLLDSLLLITYGKRGFLKKNKSLFSFKIIKNFLDKFIIYKTCIINSENMKWNCKKKSF